MKSKKGVFGSLGRLIIAVALLAVLMIAFFGNGLIPKAYEKIKNAIKGVPEIDPQEKELNFFRNNDKQLEFLTSFDKTLQDSLKCTLAKDACLTPLPNFDAGFYIEDQNYNLYLDQTQNGDINIRLTRWAKQDVAQTSAKVEAPVTSTVLKNTKLCIIKDAGATEFYKQFNEITSNADVPDASQITPTPVISILVSSGIEEKSSLERKIGFKLASTTPQADYEYHTLFKKKARSTIYALRLQRGGVNYICFLPANDDLLSSCSSPIKGFLDSDCFDSDNSKYTLKTNMGTGLIPKEYICGDSTIVDPNCLCGGTTSGTLCETDISKNKCDCAMMAVNKYTTTFLNKLLNDKTENFNMASGSKCSYGPEACKYLLISQPNFLNDIKSSSWQCTT